MCHLTKILSGVMFAALYLIALGTGGIKPCVSSFGADQFDETDKTQKTKKSSYFNWFYFSINVGTLIASTLLVYVQTNSGWALGFAIPAVAMVIAVFSLLFGTRLYRYQTPGGSPLSRISQVIVASFSKFQVHVPDDSTLLYETPPEVSAIHGSRKLEHTNGMRFLDKAAVTTTTLDDENNSKAPVNPWRLCTVTQVEELKSVIRLLLIKVDRIFSFLLCLQPLGIINSNRYLLLMSLELQRMADWKSDVASQKSSKFGIIVMCNQSI